MFGLKKKKKLDIQEGEGEQKEGQPQEQKVSPEMVEEIHTMPQQFHQPEKKGTHSKKKWVVTGIIISVVAVAGVSAYFIYTSMVEKAAVQQEVMTDEEKEMPDAMKKQDAMKDSMQDTKPQVQQPEVPTQVTPPQDTQPEGPITQEVGQTPSILISGAADVDGDGLTLNEEKIYSTDPGRPDTDNDTFTDGEEIRNLYSPTQAGQQLAASNLVMVYADASGYRVLYPAGWLQTTNEITEGSEAVFNSRVGESVKIIVRPLTLSSEPTVQAYARADNPALTESDFETVTVNNANAVRTTDGLKYYVANNIYSEMYIFVYEVADEQYKNFMTTFEMMVKSFTQG